MRISTLAGRVLLLVSSLAVAACGSEAEPKGGSRPVYKDESLGATGLFSDLGKQTLVAGVMEYRPRWDLWSDGATKRRWLSIPEGSSIDTTDMDAWVFPVGTKAWKEFSRDGVLVETRLLEKISDSQWGMVAYHWNEDLTDALAVPAGVANASGTEHDIPKGEDCKSCHDGAKDKLLGVAAIQLAHEGPGATLQSLDARGLLSVKPAPGGYDPPGEAGVAAALGYLHTNCGNCHHGVGDNPLDLRLRVDSLGDVEATPAYVTTVGVESHVQKAPSGISAKLIVAPGSPDDSILYLRMTRRGGGFAGGQMPWLASEVVDATGSETIAAWIRGL